MRYESPDELLDEELEVERVLFLGASGLLLVEVVVRAFPRELTPVGLLDCFLSVVALVVFEGFWGC